MCLAYKKIAVATVVYPKAMEYFDEFVRSIASQDLQGFYILIVNDGVDNLKLESSNLKNLIVLSPGENPINNRRVLIDYVVKYNFDYVVFADSDDTFSSNRVEEATKLLQSYDIVVNDLSLTDSTGLIYLNNYLSQRIDRYEKIEISDILNKNFIGLSNSAVRVEILKSILDMEDPKCVAYDWWLFTVLIALGSTAIFQPSAVTYYRQHNENTAGLTGEKENDLTRVATVRSQHRKALEYAGFESIAKLVSGYKTQSPTSYRLWWEL